MPRRHDAGSDHRGFQQAQVVAREIEDLGDGCDFRAGLEIDAHQAQHRLIDHAEVGFHRWGRGRLPARRRARSGQSRC
jgi:hypothetical protein